MTTPFDGATILIVDDTPSNLRVVVDLFESRGYRVAIAQDGEEGLRRARLVRPDLILLDVMLPEADGFEICRRLKADEQTRGIPVIFMTSLSTSENKLKGFEAGGVDYVTKPLQLDEVLARAATHLNLRAARRDLEARNAQLDAYRLELERRVDERTAALSASNRQLRAEVELRRAAEERLQLKNFALDHVHESAFLIDATGRIHYVNKEACRRLGYTAEELLGLGLGDIDPNWPLELRPDDWAAHWTALKGLGGKTFESRHRTREGEIFPVEITANYFEFRGQAYVLGLARDIGERKRTENELVKHREHLEELVHERTLALQNALEFTEGVINAIPDLLFELDGAGRYLNFWTHTQELLASQREALLDHTVGETLSPEAAATVLDALREAEAGGLSFGRVIRIDLPSGPAWFELSVSRRPGGPPGEPRFLVLSRNITERVHAEDKIRRANAELESRVRQRTVQLETANRELIESEGRFRSLAESFPDFLVRFDDECRHLYVNPAVVRAFGIPGFEFIGKRLHELSLHGLGDQNLELEACIRRAFATSEPNECEARWHTEAGDEIYEIRHIPEKGGTGRVVSVLGVGRNVTRLRAVEQALLSREREFRTLAENLPDSLVRYNREARAVYVNRTFEKTVALDPELHIGKTTMEAYPDFGDARRFQEALERVIATGEPARIEIAVPDLTGATRTHEVSFVAERRLNGEIRGALAIGRDISAMKEAERMLAESHTRLRELMAQREIDRDEERRRIAREMHDELGQVLTALKLGISTLKMQFGRDHPELAARVQGLLELNDKSIQSVRAVVVSLRPAALDMGILPALQWLAQEFERHSGVSCHLSLPEDPRPVDESRAMAVYRAVQEALTNAARYAEASRVDIELRCANDGACLLEIRDDGKGFDPVVASRRSFGLIGMRERIDSIGGSLTIDSSPGAGTRIGIRIPNQPGAEASAT